MKDLLGERCRDKLLGKGCKYKLPVSRQTNTRQVNVLHEKGNMISKTLNQNGVCSEGGLFRLPKYMGHRPDVVSGQSGGFSL